jgi:dethiobiotin synthetase
MGRDGLVVSEQCIAFRRWVFRMSQLSHVPAAMWQYMWSRRKNELPDYLNVIGEYTNVKAQHISDQALILLTQGLQQYTDNGNAQTQNSISLSKIDQGFKKVLSINADINIVEGAGGWRLPLGGGHYLSDFVMQANLNVILVVNMKLGCLNHAILTYESIINDGLSCVAWVANCPTEMPYLTENISELTKLLPIPLLATLSHSNNLTKAANNFNLSLLETVR